MNNKVLSRLFQAKSLFYSSLVKWKLVTEKPKVVIQINGPHHNSSALLRTDIFHTEIPPNQNSLKDLCRELKISYNNVVAYRNRSLAL